MIFSSIFLVSLFLFSGCFGGNDSATSTAPAQSMGKALKPISHQVSFIETSSTSEVLVNSVGVGDNMDKASHDSKLASIWFVLMGSDIRLLDSDEAKQKFSKYSRWFYKNSDKYITYSSGLKSKKQSGGKYYVGKNYKINTRLLKDDLLAKNIIKDTDDLAEEIDFPVTSIMSNAKTPKFVSDIVLSFLSDKGFEVEIINPDSKVDKVISTSLALSGNIDPSYLLAVSAGSDIFIDINPTVDSKQKFDSEFKKASVSIKAYYTVSKKLLGSATGFSQELETSSDNLVLQEATNDAVNKLLSQIKRNWVKESKKGKNFKLILTTEMPENSDLVYKQLKSKCRKATRKAGKNVFDFNLQCPFKNSMELFDFLNNNYQGVGKVFREMDSNSLLIVKIGGSEEDEFEIE